MNPFKHILKCFILIQQMGFSAHKIQGFSSVWTQEAVSQPHGQTTNDS